MVLLEHKRSSRSGREDSRLSFQTKTALRNTNTDEVGNPTENKLVETDAFPNELAILCAQVFNIMNTTLGAGVLSLSHTAAQTGLATTAVLLAGFFLLAAYSFYAYAFVASKFYRFKRALDVEKKDSLTLKRLWAFLFPRLKHLVDCVVVTNCFIGCTSYLVAVGNFVPAVDSGRSMRKLVVLSAVSALQFLVSTLSTLDSLKYVSYLGFLANFLLVFLGTAEFVAKYRMHKGPGTYWTSLGLRWVGAPESLLRFSGVLVVCYNCHYASIPIFRALVFGRTNTSAVVDGSVSERRESFSRKLRNKAVWNYELKRVARGFGFVSLWAYLGVFAVNVLVAASGCLAFGSRVSSNVVTDFGAGVAATALKVATAVSVACCYPLVFRAYRESLYNLIKIAGFKLGERQKTCCDVLNILLILACSLHTNDLSRVNALRGCTMGTQIVYTIPGVLLVRCRTKIRRWAYLSGWLLIAVGLSTTLLGVYGLLVR